MRTEKSGNLKPHPQRTQEKQVLCLTRDLSVGQQRHWFGRFPAHPRRRLLLVCSCLFIVSVVVQGSYVKRSVWSPPDMCTSNGHDALLLPLY